VVYLSKLNIKYKELYRFAIKIMKKIKGNLDEVKILKKVSSLVLKKVNPHFPILYKSFECGNPVASNDYPQIIQKNTYLIVLNELATGDLKTFITLPDFHTNYDLIKNTIQQIYISILSFHIHTKKRHDDCHWGNFLYHKIKPGGYIHYRIYDTNVYIENMGYLWVIWDYGKALKLTFENLYMDYYRITSAFKNNEVKNDGWVDPKQFIYDAKTKALTSELTTLILKVDTEQFIWYDKLLKSKLFSRTDRKPPDNEIINLGNPYILK
jgi:hypothetical protein